jgi:hypothetical protein
MAIEEAISAAATSNEISEEPRDELLAAASEAGEEYQSENNHAKCAKSRGLVGGAFCERRSGNNICHRRGNHGGIINVSQRASYMLYRSAEMSRE